MNGAELDTRRRALGLSIAETADVLGVTERSVSYWINGVGQPRDPEQVAARLVEVEEAMDDLVDSTIETAHDAMEERVVLFRYRTIEALRASENHLGLPLGAHAMAISWTIDDLRTDGHIVIVEWGA